jgi:hypothetical protein
MSNHTSVHPDDILPDGSDSTSIHGQMIRKGTIAAFLANLDILENNSIPEKNKLDALKVMKELAPAIITIGLHKHVIFKNPRVEELLINTAKGAS